MLRRDDLSGIPGVLGDICRQRYEDYGTASLGEICLCATTTPLAGLRLPGLSVIAEVKRASPRGELSDLDAVASASTYERAGARMISVLTEPSRFRGSLGDLRAVSQVVRLPVLRKDFVVHEAMLDEAVEAGARVALLIVAALGRKTGEFLRAARARNLEVLVEAHTADELEIALELHPTFLGVNNRDLHTLELDMTTSPRLGALARRRGFAGVLAALSGYDASSAFDGLEGVFNAILVGSSLSLSLDPERSARELVERAGAVPAWQVTTERA